MECSEFPSSLSALCEKVLSGHDPFEANIPIKIYAIISVPLILINIFGVYLIIYHSRTFLKPLRTQLLILQVEVIQWELISISGDFGVMELLQPTIYFPLALGHINGPLCTVLNMSPAAALFCVVLVFTSIEAAIGQVMMYKHQMLQSPGSRWKMKPWKFHGFMISFYVISVGWCLSIFLIGDLPVARLMLNESYPFLSSYIFSSKALMMNVKNNVRFTIWWAVIVIGTSYEVLLGTFLLWSCYNTINSRLSSKKTRKYEMKLLIALTVQLVVPMITYLIPVIYSIIVLYNEIWFVQDYNNFAVFFITQHSFLSTILMIYMNRPYREATKSFILMFPLADYIHTSFFRKNSPPQHSEASGRTRVAEMEISRITRIQPKPFRNSIPPIPPAGQRRMSRRMSWAVVSGLA